jgi:hypothetical protein
LKMRAPHAVPLAPLRRLNLVDRTMYLGRQRNTHAVPHNLVVGTDKITKSTKQSTRNSVRV